MRPRLYQALMILVVVLIAVPASLVTADNIPEPTYVYTPPVLDGDYSEWDLTGDFFAYLYEAAKLDHPILGMLYLRYDCNTNVLYALVLVNPDPIFDPPLYLDISNLENHMLKLEPNKLLDAAADSPADGVLPDLEFIWENGLPIGWEAAVYLAEGVYGNFNAHAQTWYNYGSQTSSVEYRSIALQLDCEPTAVDLMSFTAEAAGPAIQLAWETATEVDNLGFNLYRVQVGTDALTKLNADLIPGQMPGSPVGGTYSFLDTSAVRGISYYYWLEDVDLYGETAYHGPALAALKAYMKVLPGRPRPVLVPSHVAPELH